MKESKIKNNTKKPGFSSTKALKSLAVSGLLANGDGFKIIPTRTSKVPNRPSFEKFDNRSKSIIASESDILNASSENNEVSNIINNEENLTNIDRLKNSNLSKDILKTDSENVWNENIDSKDNSENKSSQETAVDLQKTSSTDAVSAKEGPSLFDKVVGVIATPIVELAHLSAISGRAYKTGSMWPPKGVKTNTIDEIKKYGLVGIYPHVIAYRTLQTACLPVAAIGKATDVVMDSKSNTERSTYRTRLGHGRSIFGYTANAVDALVARPALSPLAGVGKITEKVGPSVNKALGLKEEYDTANFDNDYWDLVEMGAKTAIRGATLPAATGSILWDKALKANGREVTPQTYSFHAKRGVKNSVKVPCAPIAVAGWGLPLLEEKTFGKLNLKVAEPKERKLDVALKDKYWETVGTGVAKICQIPFNVAAIPGAIVSATHDPINRALGYKDNYIEKNNIIYHGLRGTGMVVGAPLIATGAVVTGGSKLVSKAMGKESKPDETLNGYDYSIGGLALEGAEDVIRTAALPTYVANSILTKPIDGNYLPDREKNSYFEASGKGLLQVIALPVLAPAMVVGTCGLAYDKVTNTENTNESRNHDNSVVGLGMKGLTRTARGSKWAYEKVVEPTVKSTFKAIEKAYNSLSR